MKKAYEKPEIKVSENAVFEKVYAGGCTKVSGRNGCYWDASTSANGNGVNQSGHNAHKNLDPGQQPEGDMSF